MATDRMYELALRFKGTKLWQMLYDDEVFAVKLSDGEIGYCSVLGMLGDHYALTLYVGSEGYQSYRLLLDADYESLTALSMDLLMISQNCLQCSFENREMLSDEELDEVRQYAQANGKTVKGRNAYPQFAKYQEGRVPWDIETAEDEQRICDALSAAIALKKILRQYSKEDLRLYSLQGDGKKIPMMAYENNRWIVKYTQLPEPSKSYPEPLFTNEVLAARIRRKKKRGIWECGTIRIPEPVQEEGHEEEAPYYPLGLISVDPKTEMVKPPILANGEDTAKLMNDFAVQLLNTDVPPKTISCGDDRCFALLKDFCEKTGIQIERSDELEALDEVLQSLLENMAEDEEDEDSADEELNELLEKLAFLSDADLRSAPKDIKEMLYNMAEMGVLPDELSQRIKKLFHRKSKK